MKNYIKFKNFSAFVHLYVTNEYYYDHRTK